MQTSSNGRVRRSAEDWQGVMSRFQASGLGPKAFCQAEQVGLSSFLRWRQKLQAGDAKAGGFVELEPVRDSSTSTSWAMEIELPGGCIVRLRG